MQKRWRVSGEQGFICCRIAGFLPFVKNDRGSKLFFQKNCLSPLWRPVKRSVATLSTIKLPVLILFFAAATLFFPLSCSTQLYTQKQLQEYAKIDCPEEFHLIIKPLVTDLSVVLKALYIFKKERERLKDNLWDGGTNQRILRIDDKISSVNREILRLNQMRAEILDLIYLIVPDFTEPVAIGYLGEQKRYQKITKPIILVGSEDLLNHRKMVENGERVFPDQSYKYTVRTSRDRYEALIKSECPIPLVPIGAKGPVKKLSRKDEQVKRTVKITY
jgi:hypothetical protein